MQKTVHLFLGFNFTSLHEQSFSIDLMILTEKNYVLPISVQKCFLATSDLFHMFAQSLKHYFLNKHFNVVAERQINVETRSARERLNLQRCSTSNKRCRFQR